MSVRWESREERYGYCSAAPPRNVSRRPARPPSGPFSAGPHASTRRGWSASSARVRQAQEAAAGDLCHFSLMQSVLRLSQVPHQCPLLCVRAWRLSSNPWIKAAQGL